MSRVLENKLIQLAAEMRRLADEAHDAVDECQIAEWFEQANTVCLAEKVSWGRIPQMVAKRGIPGTMVRCMELAAHAEPLAALKEKGLLEWSFEAGIIKFADYFRRHFVNDIVARAQSRLDEVEGQEYEPVRVRIRCGDPSDEV